MRLSTVLVQCCALVTCAAAKDAYLYTFNDNQQSPSVTSEVISADLALAIAARRQGAAEKLSLKGVGEAALSQISEHGGYHPLLFTESTNTAPPRVLVRIQADKTDVRQSTQKSPAFKIQEPTKDLLMADLQGPGVTDRTSENSRDHIRIVCRVHQKTSISSDTKKHLSLKSQPVLDFVKSCLANPVDLVSASIDIDYTSYKVAQSTINSQVEALLDILHVSISTLGIQPTVLILPPASQLAASTDKISRRQDVEEEPLDLTTPSASISDFDSTTIIYKSNTTLPRRFPSCFSSLESCNNGTNSCSGHGTCKVSGSNKNCYKCKCGRTTIRTNKDGSKKTDLWAGGACQKKDISVEFVLFASFAVTMTALVFGVIGMMYSMGSQELPSVLGAGVAGPSARK